MNTIMLHYAVEVEKAGSITQAANSLGMDQPNLSKAIKSLEETMGIPIFNRTKKGVVPTDKGKVFLGHARSILSQIEEMEAICMPEQNDQLELSLSIPRASYISSAIARLIQRNETKEGMSIWLKETNAQDTIREVENGEYGLGIIRYERVLEPYYAQMASDKGMETTLLWEYDSQVLMSKEHPLASREVIEHSDLEQYSEIIHGDMAVSPFPAEGVKKNAGKQQSRNKIYMYERGSQFDLMWEDHNTFMWDAPISQSTMERHGLVQRTCKGYAKRYQDVLIYRGGYQMTGVDKEFLDILHGTIEEVSRKDSI